MYNESITLLLHNVGASQCKSHNEGNKKQRTPLIAELLKKYHCEKLCAIILHLSWN